MPSDCLNNSLISSTNPPINNLSAGRQYLFFDANPAVTLTNLVPSSVSADSTHNSFNIGTPLPSPVGASVYVTRVIFDITTIFSGGGVSLAKITDGTNILMSFTENDLSTVGVYISILPLTFISNGAQCVIQFYHSDGTTSAVPTSGVSNITIEIEDS